ncbi:MAG: hypothetical protein ACFCD0_04020 [Gemmataceae bacterium]
MSTTRQLLDELDALMEKMLSLPVEDSDQTVGSYLEDTSVPGTNAPLGPAEPKQPERTVPSYKYEELEEEKQVESPVAENIPQPTAKYYETPSYVPPSTTVASKPQSPPVASPEIPPTQSLAPVEPPVLTPETQSVLDRAKAKTESSGAWILWPFRLLNAAFDGSTHLLGPLGTGLRTSIGRKILGWLGVVMLLAAGVWQLFLWYSWKGF